MALTSSSTITDVLAQYNDNLVWEGSPSKATLALEAIRWLLINREEAMSARGRSWNWAALEQVEQRLAAYVAATSTTAKASRRTFTRGKMLT